MKISRYIYIPFIFGALYALLQYLLVGHSLNWLIWDFIYFTLFGFGMLLHNDYRVRKLAPKDNEEAFKVRQKRNVVLFTGYAKAFDLCLESVGVLEGAKIKHKDELQGIIKAKTKINWHTFGIKITFKLNKLTESTTEIEISTEPTTKTALLDHGESFKAVEGINNFLDKENDRINRKYIESKMSVPADFVSDYKHDKVKAI